MHDRTGYNREKETGDWPTESERRDDTAPIAINRTVCGLLIGLTHKAENLLPGG